MRRKNQIASWCKDKFQLFYRLYLFFSTCLSFRGLAKHSFECHGSNLLGVVYLIEHQILLPIQHSTTSLSVAEVQTVKQVLFDGLTVCQYVQKHTYMLTLMVELLTVNGILYSTSFWISARLLRNINRAMSPLISCSWETCSL